MIDTSNKEIQSHYDFIVVGAGAAGSVLAAELSASGAQVLVIESGGPDNNPDKSLTIDTHHHILPDFFWRETNDSHVPVGGLAPLQWSKEAMISFMDDAGIDVAVMSVSTPGVTLAIARRLGLWRGGATNSRPNSFIPDRTGLQVSLASHCRTSMPRWKSCPAQLARSKFSRKRTHE
jgi:choline dehydrogenase-like flavoprotein